MLRAQQWNSQIWLSGWYKATISRGGDAKRALLTKVFTHNLDIFRDGAYRTESDRVVTLPVSGSFVDESEMFSAPIILHTKGVRPQLFHLQVLNRDCILVTRDLVEQGYNPALLNMASLYHPGGGVLQGSGAQEEELCRRSTLAISLYQFSLPGGRYGDLADMVRVKRRDERYPMDNTYGGIYSPDITFFRGTQEEGYALLDETFQAAVISVASLNYNPKHGHNTLDNGNIPEADKPVLKEKIRTILRIGALKGHDSLVLGALGCGAFCTPPAQMARLFHEVLDEKEFEGRFSKIVFAIIDGPSSNNFKPFLKEFQGF